MRKAIIIIVLLAGAFLVYQYLYKDHRDIASETVVSSQSTSLIHEQFMENPKLSIEKYLNKTVEVTGSLSNIGVEEITLDNKVFCLLNESVSSDIKVGQSIKVKGRVIGFDDLLQELKLDQCTIIN